MGTYTVGPAGSGANYEVDGISDNEQINLALTAANLVPGSIVYLKGPCIYDIRLSLEIGNNLEFTGDSTAVLRIHDGMTWAAQVPVIKQKGASLTNIKIHGFEIDCNRDHQVGGEGDGLYNAILLAGYNAVHGNNITIYDMFIHDSLGDGCRIKYVDNFLAYGNRIENMGHEGIYCIEVVGGDIYGSSFIQKDNSSVRLDNSQNVNIHDNISHRTSRDDKNGNSAIQIGNQPASLGHTRKTANIKIYNNVIYDGACSGIMLMDADGTSGTTAQTVHIFNNTLTTDPLVNLGCGWMTNVNYNSGISIWNWGNGAVIENNTISGAYNAGILIANAITSGCTIQINNNNITGTKRTLSTNHVLAVSGYGVQNMVPSKMAVRAELNYSLGNLSGDYYQVTPISVSTVINPVYTPGTTGGGGSSTGGVAPPVRYIPPIRIIQEDLADYYIPEYPRLGYVNGVPVNWQKKATDTSKSIGQKKPPGVEGWNLSDFNFAGGEITIDGFAFTIDDLYEVIAAFYDTSRGRATFEFGGPYTGKQVTGLAVTHSTNVISTDVLESGHPYSVLFLLDKPLLESTTKKVRGKHVYGTTEWSADDCYAGNLLKNPSFEEWSKSTEMTFTLGSTPADNEYRCTRWSPELHMFCAVAATSPAANTKIITSLDGDDWAVPTGLTNATNYANRLRGLTWGSSIGISEGEPLPGRWVAVGITSAVGADFRSIYSDLGVDWTAGGTTPLNSWGSCCYIRNDVAGIYRYVAVSFDGTNRVMYSDDGAVNWTNVASANDSSGQWISVCYSETLDLVVAVSYNGQAMWSDDHAETWTLGTTPSPAQKWTCSVWAEQLGAFFACSEDGTQQIMTTTDGKTWTLQATPVAGSQVNPGEGEVVSTEVKSTLSGYNYSTSETEYDINAAPTFVTPAPPTGHKWRIDNISFKLRTTVAGGTAHFWMTAETATKSVVTLCEATTTNTEFTPHTHAQSWEGIINEAATIKCYMKSSSTDRKAVATLITYTLTDFNGEGGSTISYTYNAWRGLVWSPENEILVCVAQTSVGGDPTKRAMISKGDGSWDLIATPADGNWFSICYSAYLNKFAAVGFAGTGNRAMSSGTYGSITAPTSWIKETEGQSRSDAVAHDGEYALKIVGDGVAEDVGRTAQYTQMDAGVSYVLSAWGSVSGLTHGKLAVDIYSGNSVIIQLLFEGDCEYTQLFETIRLDTEPTDAYIRVHAIDTPNAGSEFYCDDVLLEKSSDFEIGTTGSDITTLGHVDVTPDIEIVAITSSSGSNITTGNSYTRTDGDVHSGYQTAYTEDFKYILPALANGKYYRFDKFTAGLCTGNTSGTTAYLKVTIQLGSGTEKQVMAWTSVSRLPNYTLKSLNTEIYSVTNQIVTLRWYIKTTKAAVKCYSNNLSFSYTEIIPTVQSSAITIYNKADYFTQIVCCNELKPGCKIQINSNGTGTYQYTESFADTQYQYAVTSSVGITYIEDEKAILFASAGNLIYCFDTKFPITGIPFIAINTVSGAPLVHIAPDNNGVPGTWYAVDLSSTVNVENYQVNLLLNSGTALILNSLTRYHLRITSGGSVALKINSIFMYCDIITLDVEHPKIFKNQVNTFKAEVTSTSSAVINLKFRDADMLV